MIPLLRLAWRNLWRHKSRSLITVLVLAFSVFLSLVMFGFSGALKNAIFELLTKHSGHLVVRVQGWKNLREFDKLLIPNAAGKVSTIQKTVPEVEVKQLLEVPALLAGERRSRGVQILGSEALPAEQARFAKEFLREGKLPQDSLDAIALGIALAQAVRVKLGDTVYVIAPGTEGSGAAAYEVVGLLDFPENAVEARVA